MGGKVKILIIIGIIAIFVYAIAMSLGGAV